MSSTGNCPWSPFILVYINDFPAVYRFADDTLQLLTIVLLDMYRLLNVYRKIFGTRSYGEDAQACECISTI